MALKKFCEWTLALWKWNVNSFLLLYFLAVQFSWNIGRKEQLIPFALTLASKQQGYNKEGQGRERLAPPSMLIGTVRWEMRNRAHCLLLLNTTTSPEGYCGRWYQKSVRNQRALGWMHHPILAPPRIISKCVQQYVWPETGPDSWFPPKFIEIVHPAMFLVNIS